MSVNREENVTAHLAKFVSATGYVSLPVEVVGAAKRVILDYVGVTIAGSLEPAGRLVAGLVQQMGCAPKAVVVGCGFRTSTSNAALANGTMAHVLDYDDISTNTGGYPVSMHLSAVLLPAILAVGEELRASGPDIITSYVLGYEVASQLANAMGSEYGDRLGWHPTSPLGTVAASAAAARLLKLDVEQTANAMGVGASQAAGLRQNFGTMTKAFHIGNAARSGVISAILAKDGFTAAPDSLEGQFGFFHAFSGGRGYDASRIASTLGEPFQLVSSESAVKLYPCCGSAHGALNALFSLIRTHDITPENVATVEVSVPFDPPRSLICPNPNTALEGKFSLQYCLAAALVDRNVGLATFTTEQVQRAEVRRLFERITMFREPKMKGKPSWEPPDYVVTVKMQSGDIYSERARAPFVAPVRVADWREVADKYQDCASLVLSTDQVKESIDLMKNMEQLDDINRLADVIMQRKP